MMQDNSWIKDKTFSKVKCSDIYLGERFSAPVFFDDGENMFLAEGKTVKPYHLLALKRWAVPYLLTYGRPLREDSGGELGSTDDINEDIGVLEDVQETDVSG